MSRIHTWLQTLTSSPPPNAMANAVSGSIEVPLHSGDGHDPPGPKVPTVPLEPCPPPNAMANAVSGSIEVPLHSGDGHDPPGPKVPTVPLEPCTPPKRA